MAGYTKTHTLDFTASGDTVYVACDKLEDNEDDIISWINNIKKSYSAASAPTSPAPDEGQLWWDTTNDLLKVYDGSSWIPVLSDHKVLADGSDPTEGYLNAKVQKSVTVDETNHKIELTGDEATPGSYHVYGTDSGGTKGWQSYGVKVLASSGDGTPGYLDAKVDDTTIEVSSNALRVKDGGVGTAKLADLSVSTAKIANSSVTQAKLKTSSGSVSTNTTTDWDHLTLPGGEYGFYPRFKVDSPTNIWATFAEDYDCGLSYITLIAIKGVTSATKYVQQRYVTSSGEVFWIFLLRDKTSGNIISGYQAPDHPCFGNGADPILVPHPFGNYDPTKHEIIVINPTEDELKQMKSDCKSPRLGIPQKDILELFAPELDEKGKVVKDPLYVFSETEEREYSKTPITIGVVEDEDSKPLWLREKAEVIKLDISKYQPEYVKVRPLKRRRGM